MRKKIIAANWKMNMTQGEATAFVSTFLLEVSESREVEIVIVPPFTAPIAVNGGTITISTSRDSLTSRRNVETNAVASPWVMFIFQFAAMIFFLMGNCF